MEEKDKYDVVVAGHICLDIIPAIPNPHNLSVGQLLVPGRLINTGSVVLSTGGAVANTGIVFGKLGMNAWLMGKIGNDYFGSGVVSILRYWNADKGLTIVDGEETSYSVVVAPEGIDRIFLHNPGANDSFCLNDIDFEIVAQSRLFHLGYPTLLRQMYINNGKELIEIFRRVKELGVTTSLDVTLPDENSDAGKADWKSIVAELLPYVDIVPWSAQESMFMLDRRRYHELRAKGCDHDPIDSYGMDDFVWIAERLLDLGAKIVLVKCGHQGMLLQTVCAERMKEMGSAMPANAEDWSTRQLWEETFRVEKMASATGAGDSSIAGFLTALLRGLSPEQSLKVACCVGAQNVQAPDAISGIKDWERVVSSMEKWEKVSNNPGAEWIFSENHRTWFGPIERE